jgi:dienelactone hydrolase
MKKNIFLVLMILIICAAVQAKQKIAAEPSPDVKSGLQVVIEPADQLYGVPFSLRITGLKANETVTLEAHSTDAVRVEWQSSAVFKADEKGTVDVNRTAPVSGDYTGVDSLGLLWSMNPIKYKGERVPTYNYERSIDYITVRISAVTSEGKTAAAMMRRYFHMPGSALVRVPLQQDGLEGYLYYPDEGGPHPGLIILSGSDGGLHEWLAQVMASNGFAALTLAYWGYRDLPKELVEIPLEYFQKAIAWMKTQKAVRADRLAVVGGSKGGELALLLGATYFDDIKAVVAWVPSGITWKGISEQRSGSSWSRNGKGLPYIPWTFTREDAIKWQKGELHSFRHLYAFDKIDPAAIDQATIKVEKIKGPVLLVSGTDDQTWPSSDFSDMVMQRLEKFKHPYEYKHLKYEGAGHKVFLPYLITGGSRSFIGGTPKANAHGGMNSWTEMLAFLHRHLDQ